MGLLSDKEQAATGLLSFLQGASNSAASTLSAPVDGINWLLRKAGLPVSDAPVGGSDWLRQKGLTAEPQNRNAGLLGEAIGGVIPMVAAAKAPQIASAINQGMTNLAAPRTLNPQTGAIVWHGSPHKFDKFDASKIGTGEGAQAYGHGLYVAESPEVAGEYARMNITGPGQVAHIGAKNGPDGAMRALQTVYPKMPKQWYESAIRKAEEAGNIYKIDLPDEHVAKMINWDDPVGDQIPAVRDVLHRVGREPASYGVDRMADDMRMVEIQKMFQDPAGVQRLREMGIPGIRYLDQNSRVGGKGTSNFVVFPGNEDLLKILERNGQPVGLLSP